MLVIGLGNKSQHGKDFACKVIIDTFKQYDIRRYSFGDQVKIELFNKLKNPNDKFWQSTPYVNDVVSDAALLDMDFSDKAKLELVEARKTILRPALQTLGNGARESNPFIWIRKVREKIKQDNPQVVIIPDVRYTNEYNFVKSLGGFTIKVIREGYLNPQCNNEHVSETQLDGTEFDYTISCKSGDIEGLTRDAITVFKNIERRCMIDVPEEVLMFSAPVRRF